jgi:diketogulonate reductase-like aldo/keto reductase
VPPEDTVAGFEDLERAGLIRHWGVSNFDLGDMTALLQLPGGARVRTDQVLYNLAHRGIEWTLLPWSRQAGLPLMAYSPLEQGRLAAHPVLRGIATRHKATAAQIALAWVVAHPGVCAIPEAGTPGHVRENARAAQVHLGEDDLSELDAAFPPPLRPIPLEVL